MPNSSLFYRDKFKFLTNAFTSVQDYSRNIRDYIDRNIPDRFKSTSNIFNLTLDVVQDISTLHLLHQEDLTNELNVFTAQHNGNLRGMAQLSGHQPVLPMSSSGIVKLTINKTGLREFGSKVILSDTAKFRCKTNGLMYSMQIEQPIRIQTSAAFVYANLIEGERRNQTFVIDGNSTTIGDNLYTINLDDNGSIENDYLKVYVDNKLWKQYDSLRDMASTSEGYLKRVGYGSQLDIIFGNDVSGKRLQLGNTVRIEYMITNGEQGNAGLDAEFELISGLIDVSGNDINAREYFKIVKESGFDLGSNGESADVTRAMTGWSSRSNTFARAEYVVAYLSRLSMLSYVTAWTEADDLIFNILGLPKITLSNARDYFSIDQSKLLLTTDQVNSIKTMLASAGKQWISTSFVFVQPKIKKYVMFVYIEGNAYDVNDLKMRVENAVAEIMLERTYGDVDKDISNNLIAKSDFINIIRDMPEVESVAIDIVTEDNEEAMITGSYKTNVITTVGASQVIAVKEVIVPPGTNPRLGLSELGDVLTNDNEVPVLRGGFRLSQEDSFVVLPNNGLNIMLKQNGQWTTI